MTLMVCIRLVSTDDGLFVLPIALAFHWMQGNLGLIYKGLTGREVAAIYDSDWRPMVMIALGCCLALAAASSSGCSCGSRRIRRCRGRGSRSRSACW